MIKDNYVLSVSFEEAEDVAEPVTLNDVKAWCKIDIDDEDELLTSLITVGRQVVEQFINRSLIDRTVTARVNNSMGNGVLPYGIPTELTSIAHDDGIAIDVEESYLGEGGILVPCFDCPVKVVYDVEASVTETIKKAVLMQVAFMNENRGDGSLSPLAKSILIPYIR